MCIRDRNRVADDEDIGLYCALTGVETFDQVDAGGAQLIACLLYTSDAADERSSVDLGGRRIIKKNKIETQ